MVHQSSVSLTTKIPIITPQPSDPCLNDLSGPICSFFHSLLDTIEWLDRSEQQLWTILLSVFLL